MAALSPAAREGDVIGSLRHSCLKLRCGNCSEGRRVSAQRSNSLGRLTAVTQRPSCRGSTFSSDPVPAPPMLRVSSEHLKQSALSRAQGLGRSLSSADAPAPCPRLPSQVPQPPAVRTGPRGGTNLTLTPGGGRLQTGVCLTAQSQRWPAQQFQGAYLLFPALPLLKWWEINFLISIRTLILGTSSALFWVFFLHNRRKDRRKYFYNPKPKELPSKWSKTNR